MPRVSELLKARLPQVLATPDGLTELLVPMIKNAWRRNTSFVCTERHYFANPLLCEVCTWAVEQTGGMSALEHGGGIMPLLFPSLASMGEAGNRRARQAIRTLLQGASARFVADFAKSEQLSAAFVDKAPVNVPSVGNIRQVYI